MGMLSKPLLIGATIVSTAAVLLYIALSRQNDNENTSNNTKSTKSSSSAASSSSLPKLPKEQLLSVLEAISNQMGQVVIQLAKIEQKIRQESANNGRVLPEDQLASYLMGQFEEAMKAIEAQTYTKFNTCEEDVRDATEYYDEKDDKEVKDAVNKLQELYRLITGTAATDVEIPADLTLEKFLGIMEETMESLNVAMEEVCMEVKELDPQDKEEAINQRYVKRADQLSSEIHKKYGLTRDVLQAAMMKYQQEPAFLMRMTELQSIQAERFAAAGSIFNGEVNMGANE